MSPDGPVAVIRHGEDEGAQLLYVRLSILPQEARLRPGPNDVGHEQLVATQVSRLEEPAFQSKGTLGYHRGVFQGPAKDGER